MESKTAGNGPAASQGFALRRWLPLLILAGAIATVFGMGWHKLLSFETIGANYDQLRTFIDKNLFTALAAYMLAYIVVVALSLPGALIMTLSGGLLFGWQLGAPAAIIAATIGGTILFMVAKTSFGDELAAKAGPWLARLSAGFKENALSYLLFLRLVPVFPFFVVNLAPALLGVPLSTFVLGTFLGIIPGTFAYAFAGAGLGSVVAAQNAVHAGCLARMASEPGLTCPYTIDTSHLVTRELVAAFAVLGVVALIPVVLKKWRERNGRN
jgi:uncharacterized membrane protein YdjX (TVP38/TMEM64 family)